MKQNHTDIAPTENHRTNRESGSIVYPVYSRRSEGLSIGINLFPDKKICSFDCPYCEVFPFETNVLFSVNVMKSELTQMIQHARKQNIPIKDICFSGNGEPTMPPHFEEALNEAALIRDTLAAEAKLVVITNGTMLLHEQTFNFLADAAAGSRNLDSRNLDSRNLDSRNLDSRNLDIWLKIDAGTEAWYEKINRSEISFSHLVEKITRFAAKAPFTIQTMLCSIDGQTPPNEENSAWTHLVTDVALIAKKAFGIKSIQIYGKARPAPEDPKAEALSENVLHDRAETLRAALENIGVQIPVNVYP